VSHSQLSVGHLPHFSFWQAGRFELNLASPLIMGILNLTPDSFSDGGQHDSLDQALAHAQRLLDEGADILDVGAESTRPGATPLTADQEWARLAPVLTELVRWQRPVSVDTYHPATMVKALDLGVDIINDIWGLRQPGALASVASSSCGLCVMHMQGDPQTMQLQPIAADALGVVQRFFQERQDALLAAGVANRRWLLDPGIGFGKTVAQNLALLRHQADLLALGQPLLVGWSRKSTLGQVTGLDAPHRQIPSVAAALMAVERGARVVRVHDVALTRQALQVWMATQDFQGQ
jgi:dihydropteroate synthase